MSDDTKWWTYLKALMGNQTQQEAAKTIGISKSNITRWKAGANADPEFVVKVARAYGANVLEALVEAEFLTEEEASLTEVNPPLDLTNVDTLELVRELQNRLDKLKYLFNLTNKNTHHATLGETITELAAVRRSKAATPDSTASDQSEQSETTPSVHGDDDDDGTVRPFDWAPGTYAADSSPDEDAGREEEGADPFP